VRPRETKTLTFRLGPEHLALYDRNMEYGVEPGLFKIMVGSSSQDIRLRGNLEVMGKKGMTL